MRPLCTNAAEDRAIRSGADLFGRQFVRLNISGEEVTEIRLSTSRYPAPPFSLMDPVTLPNTNRLMQGAPAQFGKRGLPIWGGPPALTAPDRERSPGKPSHRWRTCQMGFPLGLAVPLGVLAASSAADSAAPDRLRLPRYDPGQTRRT